tara:strand:- start:11939 stop:12574 length:636 start_codon:yes stop_codon:yes gene_type:complete
MIERGELTIFDGVYTDREIHRMNEWFGTYQHWGLGYDMVEYGAASATLCKSLKWDMWSGMHIMLDDMQNLMRERLDSYIDVPYFHRCLMNNFKFGDSPMFHKDAKAEEAMTFIIYPNYKWELNWGGYTAFADDDDNVIAAINPKPGRVIAFPSRINHSGVSPTKVHEGFGRFSVAFQDPNGTSDPSTRTPSMPKDILENTGTITGLRLIDE